MFIVKIGVLSLVAVCLSYCSGRTNAAGEKLSCRSMQVEGGYGYVVVYGASSSDTKAVFSPMAGI